MMMKQCRMCGISKPKTFAYFGVRTDGPRLYVRSSCLECKRNTGRKYAAVMYRQCHDVMLERAKQYKATHASNISEYMKSYRVLNRDRLNAYYKTWHERNKEHDRQYCQAWRAAHIEQARLHSRLSEARRRARLVGARTESIDPWMVILRDELHCGICGLFVEPAELHLDHRIPLARGGPHTEDNLQVAHSRCNRRKGSRLV